MSRSDRNPYGAAVYRSTLIDEGLRAYMLQVYNYMTLGLGVTGLVAYLVGSNPALASVLIGGPLGILFMLAPLGFVFFLSFRIQKMSFSAAQTTFWAFAATMGVSLASIFLVYTGTSIARVFFITAGTFAGMSLYGYTTKRDLTAFGSFLMMGLLGIVIASLVNLFMQSSAMQFVISVIGVLVFTGLTAYDTQRVKEMYYEQADSDTLGKIAIMGALALYMDFINLFLSLLHLFGGRRD